MNHTIHAVAFVPADISAEEALILQCIDHVEEHGYQLRSVVRDWEQVLQMLRERLAEVVVVARREHVPADRLPRLEFVGHHPGDGRPNLEERPGRTGRGRRPRAVN